MKKTVLSLIAVLSCVGMSVKAQEQDSIPSKGYAMFEPEGHFKPYNFKRYPLADTGSMMVVKEQGSFAVGGKVLTDEKGNTLHGDHAGCSPFRR